MPSIAIKISKPFNAKTTNIFSGDLTEFTKSLFIISSAMGQPLLTIIFGFNDGIFIHIEIFCVNIWQK